MPAAASKASRSTGSRQDDTSRAEAGRGAAQARTKNNYLWVLDTLHFFFLDLHEGHVAALLGRPPTLLSLGA